VGPTFDKLTWLWRLWGVETAAEQAAKEAGVTSIFGVKSIFASKTFWFAILAGVLGTLQSQGVLTVIPAPYGPAVVAAVGIVLRYVTMQPVSIP
jgi:uncharacterized membrane protein